MAKDLTPWITTHKTNNFTFQLIDPHNLNLVRGSLTGAELDGFTITEDYNSDNKIAGKLTAIDNGSYVANSWIRILHRVPEYGYSEELATLIPVTYDHTLENNLQTTQYTLESTLWAISEDMLAWHFTCGQWSTAKAAFEKICKMSYRAYQIKPNARNKQFQSTVVYELGDSLLKILYDLSSRSNNQLSVDGHGRITWSPYINPEWRNIDWEINGDDKDGIVLDDSNTWTDDYSDVTNRVIVDYKKSETVNEQQVTTEVIGNANASASSKFSSAKRGYVRAEVDQVNDLNPANVWNANEIAQSDLDKGLSDQHISHKIKTMYFPCHQGEIIHYTINSYSYKCLITNVEHDFGSMENTITMREV